MSILIAYLAFRVKGEPNSIEPIYCHYKEAAPLKLDREEIEKYFNL